MNKNVLNGSLEKKMSVAFLFATIVTQKMQHFIFFQCYVIPFKCELP